MAAQKKFVFIIWIAIGISFNLIIFNKADLKVCYAAEMPQEGGHTEAEPTQVEHVIIKGNSYPVFPGAKVFGNSYISALFHTQESPEMVKAWYDRYMPKEGWRFVREWESKRQKYWKNFLRGESPGTKKNIAEQMVKIRLEPDEGKSGATIEIIPLEIRVQ